MEQRTLEDLRGTAYPNGSTNHARAYICDPAIYDQVGASVFNLLVTTGLREWHSVLDVGCGCLRVGKLLIPWLLPHCYCGVEPNKWLVNDGIDNELGADILKIKHPRFAYNADFDFTPFGQQFDCIFANSVMTHASEEQVVTFLGSAAKAIKPDGCILATFNFDDGETGQEWTYPETVNHHFELVQDTAVGFGLQSMVLDRSLWGRLGQQWMIFVYDFGAYAQARPWSRFMLNNLPE